MTAPTYESSFRNVPFALISLGVLTAVLIGFIFLAVGFIEQDDGDGLFALVMWALGGFIVAVIFSTMAAFRVHRWTIEPNGVRIDERQKFGFTGFPRRAFVSFSDIAALRHVESGFDIVYEIAASDGQVYRQMKPQTQQIQKTGAESLEAFTAQISKAVASTGHAPPAIGEGLSFWNTVPGLGLVAAVLVASIGLAVVGLAAYADPEFHSTSSRSSQAVAFVAFAPFAVGFFLYRALTRRWRVLQGQAKK